MSEQITTSCKDCVFATWTIGGMQIVETIQTGCKFNRLYKFDTELKHEDNTEYNIINGFCNRCRNNDWAAKHNYKNLEESVIKESELNYDIILLCEKEVNNFEAVKKINESLDVILELEIKPQKTIIVLNNKNLNLVQINMRLNSNIKYRNKYEILQLVNPKSSWLAINEGAIKSYAMFYNVMEVGHTPSNNFITGLDFIYNEQLGQFLMVRPCLNEYTGLWCLNALHKMLGGSSEEMNIAYKIEQIAIEQGKENLVIGPQIQIQC